VNADDFRSFLFDLANKIPKNSLLIMDNAKIHHANKLDDSMWEMLKNQYGIDHHFLPAYSPFLNPIEYAFNHVKSEIKGKELTGFSELQNEVEKAFSSVTREKASNFEQHSRKYFQQCLSEIPFKGRILYPDENQ
jgi:transposase